MKNLTLQDIRNNYESKGYYFPNDWDSCLQSDGFYYKATVYHETLDCERIIVKEENDKLFII